MDVQFFFFFSPGWTFLGSVEKLRSFAFRFSFVNSAARTNFRLMQIQAKCTSEVRTGDRNDALRESAE